MALITLNEYAERNGKDARTLRKKAQDGNFRTAYKIGKFWVIDENEPCRDCRYRTGKYVNWRKGQRNKNK